MKTIAGFANSDEGGILLLGVTDDNEIIGIDDDIMTMKKPDKDGYRLYVLQEIEKYFSKIFVINFIKIKYYEVDSKTLMVLNISPSNESIFFESKDGKNLSPKFFIRIDNSTKELIGQELSNYVIQQFGKN
jgi:predicted HTH transcriptional regulator